MRNLPIKGFTENYFAKKVLDTKWACIFWELRNASRPSFNPPAISFQMQGEYECHGFDQTMGSNLGIQLGIPKMGLPKQKNMTNKWVLPGILTRTKVVRLGGFNPSEESSSHHPISRIENKTH